LADHKHDIKPTSKILYREEWIVRSGALGRVQKRKKVGIYDCRVREGL
jgi:hypothetical protein